MQRRRSIAITVACLGTLVSAPSFANGTVFIRKSGGALEIRSVPAGTVVLTFDDGPSEYTARVLEILRENSVPATFFVVGECAVERPGMLSAILRDGHELGNHTYHHPRLDTVSRRVMAREVALTQAAITGQTGRATRLFRPPYIHTGPPDSATMIVVDALTRKGFVVVGEDFDPGDWARPGADVIVQRSTGPEGGIVLLHDGGGDRSQTVKALPGIIAWYRARGMRFATIGAALGLERLEVMPRPSISDRLSAGLLQARLASAKWTSRYVSLKRVAAALVLLAIGGLLGFRWGARRTLGDQRSGGSRP